jgi:hypothetical protein
MMTAKSRLDHAHLIRKRLSAISQQDWLAYIF